MYWMKLKLALHTNSTGKEFPIFLVSYLQEWRKYSVTDLWGFFNDIEC